MKALVLSIAAASLLAACASSNPEPIQAPGTVPPAAAQPAAVDPVGTFDFNTTVDGLGPVTGTIVIMKASSGTGYTGTITTSATEPIPVRSVTVEGQKMTVTADTPDGPINLTMEFKGLEFTGGWSMPGMSGTHTGKRRTS